MTIQDDVEKFFESGEHDDALRGVDTDLEELFSLHRPMDNRDCTCGEKRAYAYAGPALYDAVGNAHLEKMIIKTIIRGFERHRTDVIRIDPGDDDPLMPDDALERQEKTWQQYARGVYITSPPSGWPITVTRTSSSSSTVAPRTKKR